MRAGKLEYRHRYLVHGAIYTLGLAAPWHPPVWGFLYNGSSWFLLSNAMAKPTYQNFSVDWDITLVALIAFATAGAWLRTWGAAYLGATTVHRGGMEGDRIVASGPYRYTRNPLYLGTLCNTVAVCMLMRPESAIVVFLLILLVQYRLIAREEPYLAAQMGIAYSDYLRSVPRLFPRLRSYMPLGKAKPNWTQGLLSEAYVIGCALSLATFGWFIGTDWEPAIWHVFEGIVVALGVSLICRAFIPKTL